MSEMTQPDDKESPRKFEYSEAAMDQYRAGMRRSIRPALVFLPMMFLGLGLQNLHVPAPFLVVLLVVGTIATLVIVAQNYGYQRRAQQRLKAERREWEVKTGQRVPRAAGGPSWKRDA